MQDIDEQQALAKQANVDRLQLLDVQGRSDAPLDPHKPASSSDPAIVSLQPADFTLTSSVRSNAPTKCTHAAAYSRARIYVLDVFTEKTKGTD